ncbi:DUF805 domain-containing protein [Qipengyuania sp. 1NDH17]|uniref:DUF805 domain-containing protein n=1 Tax=Qipengyuania polymorpha TaxID=2867234 RepID=A0ABS7IWG7_9SPHN|nr:DUF805 domain-containing protein [Qipengyuania polymorpha]MBX7457879.1 DUF805 domain-containing protein [Qipengyuania polymorpha]
MLEYLVLPIKRLTDFRGRSRRREYWVFTLALLVLWIGMATVANLLFPLAEGAEGSSLFDALPPMSESANDLLLYVGGPLFVFLGWVHLALAIRRLHDLGKSGWWYLIILIPYIGTIWAIIWYVQDGQPYENRFGPDPKGREDVPGELKLKRQSDGIPLPAARVNRD